MNKNIFISIVFIIIIIVVLMITFMSKKEDNKEIENKIINNDLNVNKVEEMEYIYIKVNNQLLDVELENNSATKELKERLKNGDIIIETHDYGGFEKVGDLGFSLPREDKNITTIPGDIVLYQGNQISLFYNSNSWNYTKLGRVQNLDNNELKNILGNGDVAITLTLSK